MTKVQVLVYALMTYLPEYSVSVNHQNRQHSIEHFINQPQVKVKIGTNQEVEAEISTFHFLSRLQLDSVCDSFNSDNDPPGIKIDKLNDKGLFGKPSVYTGSNVSFLSQPLKLKFFSYDPAEGGANDYVLVAVDTMTDTVDDIEYTPPKLFKIGQQAHMMEDISLVFPGGGQVIMTAVEIVQLSPDSTDPAVIEAWGDKKLRTEWGQGDHPEIDELLTKYEGQQFEAFLLEC